MSAAEITRLGGALHVSADYLAALAAKWLHPELTGRSGRRSKVHYGSQSRCYTLCAN